MFICFHKLTVHFYHNADATDGPGAQSQSCDSCISSLDFRLKLDDLSDNTCLSDPLTRALSDSSLFDQKRHEQRSCPHDYSCPHDDSSPHDDSDASNSYFQFTSPPPPPPTPPPRHSTGSFDLEKELTLNAMKYVKETLTTPDNPSSK